MNRILLVLLVIIISSCGGSKEMVAEEDFDQFYNRFHTDMDFQMERIKFPLQGGSAEIDGTVPWTKENWVTMKVKIQDVDDEQYETYYERKGDTFIQGFRLKGSGFSAEYRFRRIDNKWYLVYALDTNL